MSTGLNLTGVEMCKAVRARLRALVCRARAARRDAGMVTNLVAALAVSHAGRVALAVGPPVGLRCSWLSHRVALPVQLSD